MLPVIFVLLGLAAGGVAGYLYKKRQIELLNSELDKQTKDLLNDAKTKAQELLFEAKNKSFKIQEEAKREEKAKQAELNKVEERLLEKERMLDGKSTEIEKIRGDLDQKLQSSRKMKDELEELFKKQAQELEKVAALSREEARNLLLAKIEQECKDDLVAQYQKSEQELKQMADEKARWIISDALVRCASETTAESTSTLVNLPNDEMKGRIIGREGRNINTFEQLTGVDVIVDDTPGSIVVSGFDLVRRYIAKVSLERLIEDGRIHPARIEETVQKAKEEVNEMIKDLGEKAMMDSGVTGLHPNLVKILGRLKFRVTHGQNALKHSLEVAFIAANLAAELGANVNVCRRAGLLHDIGKAVDHEVPGHHAHIGADIARKFGLSKEVVHAIEAHHGDPEPKSLEAQIVQAANLISNSRPGATQDNLDNFIKRLMELENICSSFEGVEKAFAIQAGNEVRIFVNPDLVDDLAAIKLSHNIARKIEREFHSSGPVKVHIIRDVRVESVAQ